MAGLWFPTPRMPGPIRRNWWDPDHPKRTPLLPFPPPFQKPYVVAYYVTFTYFFYPVSRTQLGRQCYAKSDGYWSRRTGSSCQSTSQLCSCQSWAGGPRSSARCRTTVRARTRARVPGTCRGITLELVQEQAVAGAAVLELAARAGHAAFGGRGGLHNAGRWGFAEPALPVVFDAGVIIAFDEAEAAPQRPCCRQLAGWKARGITLALKDSLRGHKPW